MNSSDLNVDVHELEGSYLKIGETQHEIKSISAEVEKFGLKFIVKIPDGEVILKPVEVIPAYLVVGGPGFKQFRADIPNDYNKIRENNDFNRAFMLTLLKFGKGGYNSNSGNMEYTIDLSEKENYYWMMYNLIKTSPRIDLTGNGQTGKFQAFNATFRQPAGEFIIAYEEYCHPVPDPCTSPGIKEETCFEKNKGNFTIKFPPSEIDKSKPNISIYLADLKSAVRHVGDAGFIDCSEIIFTLVEK